MTNDGLAAYKAYRESIFAKIIDFSVLFEGLDKLKPAGKGWMLACCPFHADKTPSFGFNIRTGRWRCFAGCGKGSAIDYIMHTSGAGFKEVLLTLGDRFGVPRPALKSPQRPSIREELVNEWVTALWNIPTAIQWLREKRGFTDQTLKHYQIGWDHKRQRNTIPIRDERGNVVNVRLYNAKKEAKIINYTEGAHKYGSPPRLFGVDDLVKFQGKQVILCEGEWDRLLLQQEGMMAVTGTHGCSVFKPEWISYFKDKELVIMLDCDPEGQKAAANILEAFRTASLASIKNVILPLKGIKDDKDISDFFHKRGFNGVDLQRIIDETPTHQYRESHDQEEATPLESFTEIEYTKFINKKVQVAITVCGETSEAFHAVEEFQITSCPRMAKGGCYQCKGVLQPHKLPRGAREYIGSCMSSDFQVKAMLREYACRHNQKPSLEILSQTTLKEFFCHQRINRVTQIRDSDGNIAQMIDGKNQELMEKRVYYLSSEHPKPGNYLATGWIKSHPKTQQVTMLIENLVALEDDWEGFNLAEAIPTLRAVKDIGFESLFEDLTRNVTRVYERDEMILSVLLTYCSPRWIRFNGEIIRGWLIVLIVGDSGSGKTQTYQRIAEYMNVGDTLSGLTGSRTGLAYALVEHKQKGWQVRVGRYPANSRKILTVDEVQHLPEWDMRAISKAMEEGFLQIDRVQSRGYESQTRLLLIANPRKDKVMDTFAFGCESLKTLFPPTIIRRTDFAVFANVGDINDLSFINKANDADPQAKVTPLMLRTLVFWAWNLKPEQVVFEPEAEAACLSIAQEMTEKFGYATDIPLVTLSDFRKKLARISAAMAALQLSSDEGFTKLIIKKKHVEFTAAFLTNLFSHDNCSLDDYSDIQRQGSQLEDYARIEESFIEKAGNIRFSRGHEPHFQRTILTLRITERIKREDLAEQVGASKDTISDYIQLLKRFNLIESGPYGYTKKPKFNKFIRRFMKAHPEFFTGTGKMEE